MKHRNERVNLHIHLVGGEVTLPPCRRRGYTSTLSEVRLHIHLLGGEVTLPPCMN